MVPAVRATREFRLAQGNELDGGCSLAILDADLFEVGTTLSSHHVVSNEFAAVILR
jgi:hypothetical protein